jgi:hypothetical protein
MLAALIIIGVLGIGLPVALWLIARWRKPVPGKPQVYGEVNQWLLSEYGLGSRDRSAVQGAVLGRYGAMTALDQASGRPSPQVPASLRPELVEAADGLAARVAADGFRMLRVARRIGWVQLAMGAAALVFGVGVLAAGWGGTPLFGANALLDAALFTPAGVYSGLIVPRRRRQAAQRYLATDGSENPGSPTASDGRPDKHGANVKPG